MPYDSAGIVLNNIGKTFLSSSGQVTALTDINISIGDGEFFSIVGPSGCGKTTLLRILAGLDTATTGTIDVNIISGDRPINSMVFQEQSIFPWLNINEKQSILILPCWTKIVLAENGKDHLPFGRWSFHSHKPPGTIYSRLLTFFTYCDHLQLLNLFLVPFYSLRSL